MPRVAGSLANYSFVLRNELSGRYVKQYTIELPAVTHVIKSTLASPQLLHWVYQQTLDSISGALPYVEHMFEVDEDEWAPADYLSDAETLNEWLKANRLRPVDIRDEAGELGTEHHALLEKLGQTALLEDEGEADDIARHVFDNPKDGWESAIAGWWIERQPLVEASEQVLWSLEHRFAGTVDLVWRDSEGKRVLTDLKNRKTGRGVYDSDKIQVGAYTLAWSEMHPVSSIDRTTVLIAREDGSWIEEESSVEPKVFLSLLDVYRALKGGAK